MHCPSRYRHLLPGGRSSSLVGAPSNARSSFSLLPASATVGPSDADVLDGGEGLESFEAVAWVEGEAAGLEVVPRLATDCFAVVLRLWDVGWDDRAREKSSPMVRAVWQPDRSNNPTPTVRVITPLVISSSTTCRSLLSRPHLWLDFATRPRPQRLTDNCSTGCILRPIADNTPHVGASGFAETVIRWCSL